MSKRVLCLIVLIIAIIGIWPFVGRFISSDPLAFVGQSQNPVVEQVLIRGSRRIPESTVKIWIGTREGDAYNPVQINRDLNSLNAQGHFRDVKIFTEDGLRGGKIVTFAVEEWPLLLDITYEGLKSVQQSTLLEEFRKRQIGLSKESQYDPVKARRAAAVIKEMLANEGRPEATVDPQIEEISRTAVALKFKIEEGARFRIADIEFEGNNIYSDSDLRGEMKLVKKVSLFTTFTSKDIYHKEKLLADMERLRVLTYVDNGYLRARFGEPRVEEVGRVGNWLPIIGHKGEGLKIIIPVEEGRQYTAGEIKVEDNTEFTAEQILSVLNMKTGDIVRGYSVVNKGIENLKKLYGSRGYIQFSAGFIPEFHDDPNDPTKGVADVTFTLEEGKQYSLRRLEFIGNHFTRDNVLRREVLLNEGERYNQDLWDLSLLRLNQLGYFEQIKEEDATVNTNERQGQVDMTLKVQEKGRQQISFTGGVSGIGGSFIGIDYATNNLLGYGESLSFAIAAGNRQKIYSFGFTEPYLKGRPISLGFSVFHQDFKFFGQGFSTLTVGNTFEEINDSLFSQKTTGGSITLSAPLQYFTPRFRLGRFVRLGLSYSFQTTDIRDPAVNRDDDPDNDQAVTFRQSGVTQSTITPTIFYNTLNSSLDPTNGQSLLMGLAFSGGILGGKVNTIAPTVEFKFFRPFLAGREASARPEPGKTRTVGFRVLFGHIGAFGERFQSNSLSFIGGTPLFSRFFLGGEETIRGYNIRGISPTAPITASFSTQNVVATTLSGTPLKVRNPDRGNSRTVAPSVIEQYTTTDQRNPLIPEFPQFIGGDTQLLFNAEYRIPIFGPVAFAPFFDIGGVFNLRDPGDQFITSEVIPNQLLSIDRDGNFTGGVVTLNTRGEIATQREIRRATTPETPPGGLPPGFRNVFIRGDQRVVQAVELSRAEDGIFDNYRYSMGGELRVQVPVINVPFRLIFAWNPNARTNDFGFIEEKRAVRFSIGRTF
ncbi:MAG: outer membrane protein assembly factor BamA [Blastocatellia bacterium]|nr:outer membrane protein assembly factor BamA [Blastocatellia bacterium]